MRTGGRTKLFVVITAFASIAYLGCSDSNNVTSPQPMSVATNVSGSWSGTYQSNSPALCSNGMATASFTQQGNQVSGPFKALGCKIDGYFHGTMSGNTLTGNVGMAGCTGGAVSGTMGPSGLSFNVGDFTKQLINGDAEVMQGGRASLQR